VKNKKELLQGFKDLGTQKSTLFDGVPATVEWE